MSYILKGLRWAENSIASLALLTLAISVILGVIFRYIFNNPLVWTEEVALISFIWLTFIGSSIVIREKRHIQIDLINFLPNKVRHILDLTSWVVVIIVLILFIYYGILQTMSATDLTAAIRLPWKYVFVAVPIGSVFMLVRSLEKFVILFSNSKIAEGDERT